MFKNISAEISEMFEEASYYGDMATLDYVYRSYGIDIQKDGSNRGFHFDRKLSLEDDEYLILVAFLYDKPLNICPRCDSNEVFKRVVGRRSFQCSKCSLQIYPTANTMFSKSTVPLRTWFRIMKNMAIDDVCIKDIERNFGMCYKTAHRIFHIIKKSDVYNRLRVFKHTVQYQVVELEMEYEIKKLQSANRERWNNIKRRIDSLKNKLTVS